MVTEMHKAFIICRSQTEAFAASRLLEGAGIRAQLTRPPRGEHTSACAYALRIDQADLGAAQRRLQGKNFVPCKFHVIED